MIQLWNIRNVSHFRYYRSNNIKAFNVFTIAVVVVAVVVVVVAKMRGGILYDLPFRRLVLARTGTRIVRHTKNHVVQQRCASSNSSYMRERNFWNVGISALSGFWLHLTDEDVRDKFQSFVGQKLIDQEMMTQNMGGRIQMFALLHGLMNPLLRKYQFDAVEFVNAVGPALQIYHETLLQLMTEATTISDGTETTTKEKEDIIKRRMEDVAKGEESDGEETEQSHSWRIEAERDPKSLAGRFLKMVTDENLNEQYHNAQMIQLFSQMGIPAPMNYVTGSCVVEYVSLLNIKAIEVDDVLYEQQEHPEFAASSDDDAVKNLPVLARVQVLYKLSRQFQKRNKNKNNHNPQINASLTSASESYKSINTDVTPSSSTTTTNSPSATDTSTNSDSEATVKVTNTVNDSSNKDNQKENFAASSPSEEIGATNTATTTTTNVSPPSHDPEIYSETRLGVATFEGWLNGGSSTMNQIDTDDKKERPMPQLRWKIASATESNHIW